MSIIFLRDYPDKEKYGAGSYVIIRHIDGTGAAYCHCLKGSISVKENDRVAQGQFIALSGNTGQASEPHLHFDVRAYWNTGYPTYDLGPTIPVIFEDKSHTAWRPKVGDQLASNRNSPNRGSVAVVQ